MMDDLNWSAEVSLKTLLTAACTSSKFLNLWPYKWFFMKGNAQKSHGAKSGE